jgi:transcriptional regulator NrdR family protein
MKHIIKTNGNVEDFSTRKLQKSITHSLYAVHAADEEIETITARVCEAITDWIANKHEVSTKDIRAAVTRELAKYDKDAAVLYKKHKDLW